MSAQGSHLYDNVLELNQHTSAVECQNLVFIEADAGCNWSQGSLGQKL